MLFIVNAEPIISQDSSQPISKEVDKSLSANVSKPTKAKSAEADKQTGMTNDKAGKQAGKKDKGNKNTDTSVDSKTNGGKLY